MGEKGDQGCPEISRLNNTVRLVSLLLRRGSWEESSLRMWALDPHVDTCQGQVGVRVCGRSRGRESNGPADGLVAGRDSEAPGNKCNTGEKGRASALGRPDLLRQAFSRRRCMRCSSQTRADKREVGVGQLIRKRRGGDRPHQPEADLSAM